MPETKKNATNLSKEILEADKIINSTKQRIIKNNSDVASLKARQELLLQSGRFLEESLKLEEEAAKILERLYDLEF